MIKDITLGQYFPGSSIIHRLDPRFKIIMTTIFIAMLFISNNLWGLLIGGVFALFTFVLSKIPFKLMLKSLKPLIPILIFTSIFNLLFIDGGDVYIEWEFIKITEDGVNMTVYMAIRIIFLIIGSSLLTYTTSPIALTDAIEYLLSPFKKLKMPVHEFAMMMTIALRFIPTLIEETDKIMSAQKARGADFESGKIMERIKALIPILVPLFISAFRRADDLALAMTCRCYRGGEGRTRLKQLKSGLKDYIAIVITLVFLLAIIVINILIQDL
ncbi:MAG: energy-coupling factor transporter transmembrane protein EcfT [Clostridiales bacterium]|jgi:energy-coupling factor transport system permease protein|nr:energy-coupling factor transporter transmembrane protein EcfT [Clostridiales bacterium]